MNVIENRLFLLLQFQSWGLTHFTVIVLKISAFSMWFHIIIAVSRPLFVCLSHSPSSPSLFLSVSTPPSLLPVSLIRNPVKIGQAKQGCFDQALISTVDSVSAHPDSTEPWSPSAGAPESSSSTPRHRHPKGLMMHNNYCIWVICHWISRYYRD